MRATYTIEKTTPSVVLRDCGDWRNTPTITHSIEEVIAELVTNKLLPATGKELLFYFDSEGELTGVTVHEGRFRAFFFPNSADRKHLGI